MSQQVLGGHHDEGFAELPVHLSPQHVEIVRGRGDVDDLPVVLLDLRVFKKVSVPSPKSREHREIKRTGFLAAHARQDADCGVFFGGTLAFVLNA